MLFITSKSKVTIDSIVKLNTNETLNMFTMLYKSLFKLLSDTNFNNKYHAR